MVQSGIGPSYPAIKILMNRLKPDPAREGFVVLLSVVYMLTYIESLVACIPLSHLYLYPRSSHYLDLKVNVPVDSSDSHGCNPEIGPALISLEFWKLKHLSHCIRPLHSFLLYFQLFHMCVVCRTVQ